MRSRRRLIISEALFSRAGLGREGTAAAAIIAEPLSSALCPADRQFMLRIMAREVAALLAFPNVHASAVSRSRLLILFEVAIRAGVPVAVDSMMALRLIRRLAEEDSRGKPPRMEFRPDAEH
jgi:hypothetical protein